MNAEVRPIINAMLAAALEYAARGWLVFPTHAVGLNGQCTCGVPNCSDAGKHPRVEGGLKAASRDPAVLTEWFGDSAPPANIAVVTGAESGITVIDVDTKNNGAENWQALTAEKGEPPTLMAVTGSGGIHAVFKYNSALSTAANVLAKGIDVRNDGGYIVAPPSMHRSGRRYEWMDASVPLLDLPKHLTARSGKKRGRPRKDDPTKKKYTVEELSEILEFVPADDRDTWRKVGIILGREFDRSDEAWEAYGQWSEKWDGRKGRGHDEIMRECFYELSQQEAESPLSMGTIIHAAIEGGWAPTRGTVTHDRFIYHAPGNDFVYLGTGALWSAASVDATCKPVNVNGKIVRPSDWIKEHNAVTSMTSDPIIKERVLRGFDAVEGELNPADGAAVYNAYRPPTIELGDPNDVQPFLEHVRRVFDKPGDAEQFLDYMAHRVQFPGVKPRFALLIGGEQGVGKDTAISMCVPAIGAWNVANIDPKDLNQGFNEYTTRVLVVVSEAANLQDMNRWAFNEQLKVLIAGLPDNLTVNPKYGRKYSVRLHCGVIVTSNHLLDGIFIPQDDRRYDVIEAARKDEMGLDDVAQRKAYFDRLWSWFEGRGKNNVAAYLHERDISGFSPANGQRITAAHRAVVSSGVAGDDWILDALEKLGEPGVFTTTELLAAAQIVDPHLTSKEFNKKYPHALCRAGYVRIDNPDSKRGRWKINGKDQTIFRAEGLTHAEAIVLLRRKMNGTAPEKF